MSNKTLMSALKKRLHSAKGKWVEDLPGVLWVYRTTNWKSMGESSFALTYGMEAIIPTKIGMPTILTEVHEEANAEAITKDLDTIDELWEATIVRIVSYQQRLANLHNQRVNPRMFKAKDLVLRRVFENTANPTDMKFQANWEGPYTVVRVGTTGSYALRKPDGIVVPGMRNAMHLKENHQ